MSGSLSRNTAVLLAAQVITSICSFLTFLVMPIYLGAVGVGRVAFAQSLSLMVASLCILGTGVFLVREIAADHGRLRGLVWTSVGLRVPLWALASVPVAAFVALKRLPFESAALVFGFYGLTLLVVVTASLTSALQGLERMQRQSVAAVAGGAVTFAVAIPGIVATRSPLAFCAAVITGQLVTLAICAAAFRGRGLGFELPGREAYRGLLAGSLPFMAFMVAQSLYGQVNTVLMGVLTADAEVGWFAAANRMAPAVLMVPVVLTTALLPRLARLHSSGSGSAAATLRRSFEFTVLLASPLGIGLAVIAPRLIGFLHYPAEFHHSVPILVLLAPTWALTAVAMVLGTALISFGRERAWAVAGLVFLGTFTALNLAFIPAANLALHNGGVGAAAADLGGEVITAAVAIWLLPRGLLGLGALGYAVRALAAGAAMAAVVLLLGRLPLPLSIAAGGAAYGGASLLVRTLKVGELRRLYGSLLRRAATPEEAPAAASPLAATTKAPADLAG